MKPFSLFHQFDRPSRWLLGLTLGLMLIQALWMVFRGGSQGFQDWVGNLVFIAPIIPMVGLGWYTARQHQGQARLGWSLVALSVTVSLLAEGLWAYLELVLGSDPFPSVADFFYLAFVPLFCLAVVYLQPARFRPFEAPKLTLDIAIMLASAAFVSWQVLLVPAIQEYHGQGLAMGVALAYPLTDLILLALLLTLVWRQFPTPFHLHTLLLAVGLVLQILADTTFLYLDARGAYFAGHLADGLWLWGYATFAFAGLASLKPRTLELPLLQTLCVRCSPFLPLAAVMLVVSVNLFQHQQDKLLAFGSDLLTALVMLLVGLRQLLALWENQRLLYTLQDQSRTFQQRIELRNKALEQSQLKLAEREARLQSLVNLQSTYLLRVDLEGNYTFANQAFLNQYGLHEPDILGRPLRSSVHPGDWETCLRVAQTCTANPGQRVTVRIRRPRSDGSITWSELECVAITDAQGKAVEIQAVGRDVTQEQLDQERLAELSDYHERLLQLTLESLRQGLSEKLYQRLLEAAVEVIPGAQAGSLTLLRDDGKFHFAAAVGYDLQALQQVCLDASEPLSLVSNQVATIYTRQDLMRFNERIDPERRAVFEGPGRSRQICSVICVPIVIDQRISGLFYLDNFEREDAFGSESIQLAQGFAAQVGMILQRLRLEAEVEFLAFHDPVTHLPNRRLFMDRLGQELAQAKRSQHPLAVLFIDLDNFKYANDTYGHAFGDQLLVEASTRMASCLRAGDTLARQGGDEFLILLGNLGEPQDALRVAERILGSISKPFQLQGQEVLLSASIGIAYAPQDSQNASELVQFADTAMYQAKQQGKNCYRFFAREMNTQLLERNLLGHDLHRAIQHDEFFLLYHPRLDLQSAQVVSLEVLTRWQHPQLGLIKPSRFLSVAEETGLIYPLGELILRKACLQALAWLEQGHPVPISVNISAHQLANPEFAALVEGILEETGLPAYLLHLELAERSIAKNPEKINPVLNNLRKLGLQIELDNFGTGQASLGYINRLPIAALKIDRSLLAELGAEPRTGSYAASTIRSIIALGKSLGLEVIAGGIETEAQRLFLLKEGCTKGQGFLWSRPLPLGELPGFLAQGQRITH